MSHIETLRNEDIPKVMIEVRRQDNGQVDVRRLFRARRPRHKVDGQYRFHLDVEGLVVAVSITKDSEATQLLPVSNPDHPQEYSS